jgi:plastocyanin
MVRHIQILLFPVLLFIIVAGCASGAPAAQPTPSQTASIQPPTASITISGFAFVPQTIEITAGTKVVWMNNDSVVHTVTSNDRIFDSGNMSRGATFSFTFTQPGTYEYFCIPHPYMKGTVVVK